MGKRTHKRKARKKATKKLMIIGGYNFPLLGKEYYNGADCGIDISKGFTNKKESVKQEEKIQQFKVCPVSPLSELK